MTQDIAVGSHELVTSNHLVDMVEDIAGSATAAPIRGHCPERGQWTEFRQYTYPALP